MWINGIRQGSTDAGSRDFDSLPAGIEKEMGMRVDKNGGMDMPEKEKNCTAIVLAAGSGRRMESDIPKQFMTLGDKPLICYSLQAIEQSEIIDDCILVTGREDIPFAESEIVKKYGFHKVKNIIEGGAERYESVFRGLQALGSREGYTFIHDGARPFLSEEILERTYEAVKKYGACVAAMPVKDTVKIADAEDFAVQTPNRDYVWAVQTPQVFDTELISRAYQMLFERLEELKGKGVSVTDDAMVAETMLGIRVKLVKASYENIKITTPEDMKTALGFLT